MLTILDASGDPLVTGFGNLVSGLTSQLTTLFPELACKNNDITARYQMHFALRGIPKMEFCGKTAANGVCEGA